MRRWQRDAAPNFMKTEFPLHVIYHGAKAHRIIRMEAGDLVTACGLRLPQTRPALSRDKICKACTKALRRTAVPAPEPSISIIGASGTMDLVKLRSGSLWLTNGEGEGMEIKQGDKAFEKCLRNYFNRNF